MKKPFAHGDKDGWTIHCPHEFNSDVYVYTIGEDGSIVLCTTCHMQLAGEIAKQAAIELFLPKDEPWQQQGRVVGKGRTQKHEELEE